MVSWEYIPLFAGGEGPHLETSMGLRCLLRYYHLCVARQKLVATLDAVLQKRFDEEWLVSWASEIVIFTGRRGQGMTMPLCRNLLMARREGDA